MKMTRPTFINQLSMGNWITLFVIIAGGLVAWGTLGAQQKADGKHRENTIIHAPVPDVSYFVDKQVYDANRTQDLHRQDVAVTEIKSDINAMRTEQRDNQRVLTDRMDRIYEKLP